MALDTMDEDALLQQALALSMQVMPPGSPPSVPSAGATGGADVSAPRPCSLAAIHPVGHAFLHTGHRAEAALCVAAMRSWPNAQLCSLI